MAIGFTNAQKKIGTDVSDTTAVASDVLASEDFYLANGTKATGTIPTYAGSTEITENATLETEGKYLASDIVVNVSGGTPPISTGGLFTGATIPLTYKDNTHDYENTYEYNSANYNITITGLTGRATITGNGTKSVSVAFDVSSATSSLAEFVISLSDGTNTYTFDGLHAHYGTTVTGVLTLAYTNVPRTGTGTIGTEYKFIESTDLPLFATTTTIWNTIYSYQVLNVLIGNFSSTSIGDYFLAYCHSFNQPLVIPSEVASIGTNFLRYCYSFNQPLTLPSNITSIGASFLYSCYSFNQPLTLPSGLPSIGTNFLANCYSFNQPLTLPSGLPSIGDYFLRSCYSFNQPLVIPSEVASIGTNFLYSCYSFNQPLTLPSNITSIEASFLYSCYSFNQPLTLPSGLPSIGASFLYSCYSFNQPLTLPSGITSIGTYFLNNCYSLSTLTYNSAVYPTDNDSLSQASNSKTSASGAGIIVYGTNRAELLIALPDRTASPYRKLINGGAD